MNIELQLKIIDSRIGTLYPLPRYETAGSAGMDLRACIDKPLCLKPNATELISTGVAIYLEDPHYAALVLPRSGLGHKHGIVLGNLVGLIDADYQGPLMISCWNRSKEEFIINPGERFAQLLIIPIVRASIKVTASFVSSTTRGEGGFGYTGRT